MQKSKLFKPSILENLENSSSCSKQQTSDTEFKLNLDSNNGKCYVRENKISLGTNVFTLEALIHEINEKVISELLEKDFNTAKYKEISVSGFKNALSHFLSPFGKNSFISPAKWKRNEYNDIVPLNEEFLEEKETLAKYTFQQLIRTAYCLEPPKPKDKH